MRILSRFFNRSNDQKPPLQRPREDQILKFPAVDSKGNYLAAFWSWVEILAANDYQGALEALSWPSGTTWTAETFRQTIATFFGSNEPWSVVIPNDRLVKVIDDAADIKLCRDDDFGWIMAQIPLTTQPANPKSDDIPLMGLATSFFVRPNAGHYVLEFEIFHL